MANYKMDRTSEDILRELTAILRRVKDPRVSGMISIVRVEVSNDMSYAKVYISFSVTRVSSAAIKSACPSIRAARGLKSAAGFMRRELGSALHLRHVPELRFIPDDSIAYSARIAKTLQDLQQQEKGGDGDE